MSKIRRKVTVENSKTISDSSSSSSTTTSSTSNPAAPSRRPSVFERLGPSTGSNAADVCINAYMLRSLVTHHVLPLLDSALQYHYCDGCLILVDVALSHQAHLFVSFRVTVEIG